MGYASPCVASQYLVLVGLAGSASGPPNAELGVRSSGAMFCGGGGGGSGRVADGTCVLGGALGGTAGARRVAASSVSELRDGPRGRG
jgi:hypothetical protein